MIIPGKMSYFKILMEIIKKCCLLHTVVVAEILKEAFYINLQL